MFVFSEYCCFSTNSFDHFFSFDNLLNAEASEKSPITYFFYNLTSVFLSVKHISAVEALSRSLSQTRRNVISSLLLKSNSLNLNFLQQEGSIVLLALLKVTVSAFDYLQF